MTLVTVGLVAIALAVAICLGHYVGYSKGIIAGRREVNK